MLPGQKRLAGSALTIPSRIQLKSMGFRAVFLYGFMLHSTLSEI